MTDVLLFSLAAGLPNFGFLVNIWTLFCNCVVFTLWLAAVGLLKVAMVLMCVRAGQAGRARDAFVDFLDRIPDQLTLGGTVQANSTRTGTAFDQSRPDLQNAAPRT